MPNDMNVLNQQAWEQMKLALEEKNAALYTALTTLQNVQNRWGHLINVLPTIDIVQEALKDTIDN